MTLRGHLSFDYKRQMSSYLMAICLLMKKVRPVCENYNKRLHLGSHSLHIPATLSECEEIVRSFLSSLQCGGNSIHIVRDKSK